MNQISSYVLQTLLIISCLVSSIIAVSPQNIMKMTVKYEVVWLDSTKGQFGANMTVSLPQESVSQSWKLKIKYQEPTKIAVYWGGDWDMLYNKDTYIIQPKNDSRLVKSYPFNAVFPLPKEKLDNDTVKGYILPVSYLLSVDNGADISLALEDDVQVIGTSSLRKPPGEFALHPTAPLSDTSEPTPDGLTIIGTPIGLYMYCAVFFLGALSYSIGTFQRSRFRSQFRYQANLRDDIKMVPIS
ncbi:hypothetical protein K493DRAFT_315319 [Basidiobolus meristosporus CBS 931.73]|uniref:Protein PBN1 n=1 Tax=Basidiobolus meristosporus CBS 931.73 TaxID=1314790 RepID=A0A1Y1Y9Z0_9FUNG|nr:hypothetical protein K493DRAFT_315319 [Basidiobolus meristosporus CBS 931.73]|eukprot:ORX94798.1 hypothetical protein K493DRAFT_315319 [Basidiobolus meristosporus CBS 931.73]